MRGMIFAGAVALVTIATSAAAAGHDKAQFTAIAAMPFTFKVIGVEDRMTDGQSWTVATVRVVNGPHYISEVQLSCEAGNPGGYTWGLEGKVAGLMPKEERVARIVSIEGTDPQYWSKASKVRCEVTGFSAGPMGWPVEFPGD